MNDKYMLDAGLIAQAEDCLDVDAHLLGGETDLERAQVYALVSIAESLHTLTRFLIEKEEGTS